MEKYLLIICIFYLKVKKKKIYQMIFLFDC